MAEGAGRFVAVAGPSGAGKDTLLRHAAARLASDPRIVFARRVITRDADDTEDHASVSAETFERLRASGGFLLHWEANGLRYGLPAELGDDLRAGRTVVANVSRMALSEIRARFPRCVVVHVTASRKVLAARLAARGREDEAAREARLTRAIAASDAVRADVQIDNSGDLAASLARFEAVLRGLGGAVEPATAEVASP